MGRIAARSIDGKTEAVGYDDLGRVTSDQNTLSRFTYGYFGATGQVTSVTPSDSPFKVSYEYLDNSNDRRLKTIANGTHGKSLQKFDYTTNAENQALSESAHDGYAVKSQFGYDAENRLLTADAMGDGAPRRSGYTFDAMGNLQQIATTDHTPSVQFQATYDALNRIDEANGVVYTYDAAGELIDDGAYRYTWDAVHRLVSVTNNHSGSLTSYVYDGLGRRVAIAVQSSSSSMTTNYLWCDNEICQARDLTNAVAGEFFGQGESQSGSKLLYARDRLGSVTDLVDAPSGKITASFAYDPWGNVANATGTLTPTFGFAGMFADRSTGKNLTLYRAYDPATARWISADPIGLLGGLNSYAYAGGNPISFTDPSGLLFGFNAGESYGDSAAQYWADKQNETGNWLYGIPGALAVLWTPCTSNSTFLTLATGPLLGKGGALSKFFWNSDRFRKISRGYWAARGGAGGMSLDHWAFSQAAARSGSVPSGLVNGGWNLLEMPASWNTWLGFAPNWGGTQATLAIAARWGIRIGVPGLAFASGYAGYELGEGALQDECGCK